MRILFMGTPDFALFSLKALVESGEDVIGVVTQPDKPRGRGYTLAPPPVKVYALEQSIPVYQPATLKGEEFAALLSELDPELVVVVAFGKILPKNVLDYPKYGCINVHGSLLPAYRGAAPMQRAIIDGCKTTGITTMYMDVGLDTGDMLLRDEVEIGENDNFEDMHDRLGAVGAQTLLRTIAALKEGTLIAQKQDASLATYAAKIEKEDCVLDFARSAKCLHDQIRGLSPIPLAFTHTPDGKLLKVLASRVSEVSCPVDATVGRVISLEGGVITVACGDGTTLDILRVLPEGKGRMDAGDFIRGRKINVGDLLS
ncbi:MAG: methionyl-tRNA formyltransferase [Ruminococcaceae bacterium]|nr:methionyl-tRNA formyltransferase [Oscillospiraceae bacterium]